MKKKINLIEKIINDHNYYGENIIELYSSPKMTQTLLCNKKNNRYCIETETDTNTTIVWYNMNNKEDVNELLELLTLKFL